MGVECRAVSGALGAEVHGLDLENLGDDEFAALREAWVRYHVLFFPGQHLSPDAHLAFGRRFGEVEIHPFLEKLDDDHPEIVVLDSRQGYRADVWHTDVTFSDRPPLASILQMKVLPPVGGDTIFTNQHLAYESLSAPLRDLLCGLTAVHTASAFGHPEVVSSHPAVRLHPETGRPSLFVNRLFTSHFEELRPEESRTLLDYLCTWSEQPRFQCRYRWAEGTVGIWDNRCTQHYAVSDYEGRRRIERVTVIGDVPAGPGRRWERWRGDGHRPVGEGQRFTPKNLPAGGPTG